MKRLTAEELQNIKLKQVTTRSIKHTELFKDDEDMIQTFKSLLLEKSFVNYVDGNVWIDMVARYENLSERQIKQLKRLSNIVVDYLLYVTNNNDLAIQNSRLTSIYDILSQ